MQKKSYSFYNRKYNKKMRAVYISAFIFAVFMTVLIFLLSENVYACVVMASSCAFLIYGIRIVQKTDDKYISDIVSDITELVDVLNELEEKEIFPESEDTLISKLQSKIGKLVHILKLKNKKEQAEHENIKGLVSDISHQLKTPVSNIKMYTEFLKKEDITKEEKDKYLEVLEVSVERLTFLSENMIKVSRLESGLISLDCKLQSINDTILTAIRDVYTKAKNAEIVINYEEECKCEKIHDRRWMAEALFNLLDNAVKYGKKGSNITISVRKLGTLVEIAVKDENEIIPDEERTRIFERFYRGKNERVKEGIGVGLYLTRQIVEKQGGYVSVRAWEHGNIFMVVI